MKKAYPILSPRGLFCGCITGAFCLLSRTLFGNPLGTIHLIEKTNLLPPLWIFNLLSVCTCFLVGMSFGWIADHVISGNNAGQRAVCAYRGALYLSVSFFLFVIWFSVLFYGQRFFVSLVLSVVALICSLACAVEWGRLIPTRASLIVYLNTVWLFYIMLLSLSVWWQS